VAERRRDLGTCGWLSCKATALNRRQRAARGLTASKHLGSKDAALRPEFCSCPHSGTPAAPHLISSHLTSSRRISPSGRLLPSHPAGSRSPGHGTGRAGSEQPRQPWLLLPDFPTWELNCCEGHWERLRISVISSISLLGP